MTFFILDKLHLKSRRGRVSRPVLGTRVSFTTKGFSNVYRRSGRPRPYAIGTLRPIRHAKRVVLRGRSETPTLRSHQSLCVQFNHRARFVSGLNIGCACNRYCFIKFYSNLPARAVRLRILFSSALVS